MPSATQVEAIGDHAALVAMMSDYWLPGAITAHHNQGRSVFSVTSLNHSLWLHAPVRTDEWLLYRTRSRWSGDGSGMTHELIFNWA